jgi:hypothetical protein
MFVLIDSRISIKMIFMSIDTWVNTRFHEFEKFLAVGEKFLAVGMEIVFSYMHLFPLLECLRAIIILVSPFPYAFSHMHFIYLR